MENGKIIYKQITRSIDQCSMAELKSICIDMGITESCPFNLYNTAYYFDIKQYIMSNLGLQQLSETDQSTN